MGERGIMFEVADHGEGGDTCEVRGTGGFAGQVAVFSGPEARRRAEAYARWLNAGGALQRRRTDPGFKGRSDPGAGGASAPARSPPAA